MKKIASLLLMIFALLVVVGCSGTTKDLTGVSLAFKDAGMQVETVQRASSKLFDDFEKALSSEALETLILSFEEGTIVIDVMDVRGKDKEERIINAYKLIAGNLGNDDIYHNNNLAMVFGGYSIEAFEKHKDEVIATFKKY
ncbi:hypothetical protein E2R60_20515 [Paenibacillus dendritiformis]|uniref:hypothetical protein n=1 Tax=Paenibacillus dendritiformis TaxID=130049 RepID=UPI00105A71DC|nr:hypothetical protein [Paenibacillus dendritiformis]TDL50933.1 hypothetical protein E2R60_20515 [Paenibacillus dendritiformis]